MITGLTVEVLRMSQIAAAEATVRRLRHYGSTHMRGFEAFGCVGPTYADRDPAVFGENPTVRPLGTVTFAKNGDIVMRVDDDQEDWPDAELHHGVAHISISASADDPSGCFLSVCGPDRDAVEAAWHRAAAGFEAIAAQVWQ